MSIELEPEVGRFNTTYQAASIEPQEPFVIPDFPEELLAETLLRLSAEERELAFRKDILAVSWLPQLTLHAALGGSGLVNALIANKRIIAQLNRDLFLKSISKILGPRLRFEATDQLRLNAPEFSASQRITPEQTAFWTILLCCFGALTVLLPQAEGFVAFSIVFNLFFLLAISLKAVWILLPKTKPSRKHWGKLQEEALPIYTVLVPIFRETEVLPQLIHALRNLNYPDHKLDIKIVTEESDTRMHRALAKISLPLHFEIIVVPSGKPQTKPRALNYAMKFAKGELLTIYDAEDIPEPMQLQKAAARFAAANETLACLQAELAFYNPNENWLTRQFTTEYAVLFGQVLPSLAALGLPIPLGGTSNHFRISALRTVGGWDPYNVTEDADLGIRLSRLGFSTGVLDSITYEEANTAFGNWLQQRARWLKGFLQTWLVHSRQPARLLQELGLVGCFAAFCSTFAILGAALLYPIFLLLAARLLWLGDLRLESLPHAAAIGTAITVTLAGYGLAAFSGLRALQAKAIPLWFGTLLTMPLYWLLMSVAAWMALWQFATKPFHWNKTRHGLSAFQRERPK